MNPSHATVSSVPSLSRGSAGKGSKGTSGSPLKEQSWTTVVKSSKRSSKTVHSPRSPETPNWSTSDSLISPRSDDESHVDGRTASPRIVLFLLNRNGFDEVLLRDKLNTLLESKGAQVLWLSIFGKMPERPHAFLTLTSDKVSKELIAEETIEFDDDTNFYKFQFQEAFHREPGDGEDPLSIFVTGIPPCTDIDDLKLRIKEYFDDIAPVQQVIVPKVGVGNGVIVKFPNEKCASMVARVSLFCAFEGHALKCSYARLQPARTPPPQKGRSKKR